MKTQYYTATSINGYIADENNSLDWLHRLAQVESMNDVYPKFISQIGAMAMGSATYEWVIANNPAKQQEKWWPREIPTWVFSSRELPAISGFDIRFVQGDVAPVHADMVGAADGKNIWLVGGGDLVCQFHDHGLLDEIILSVAPVMLESGAPLLPRKITKPPLKLIDVQKHDDIFAVLIYKVQKEVQK